MARPKQPPKPTSPTLELAITIEQYERAVQSNSGGCLIADAIKAQYPHLSGVQVDMATVRATDKLKGLRYVYLTPPAAQHALLSFDQGWPNPTESVVIRKAVQINRITRAKNGPGSTASIRAKREQRRAELEQKLDLGQELDRDEKGALTKLSKPYEPVERPSSKGPIEVSDAPARGTPTIVGGRPLPQGRPHPNLLRGRNRHFGAKLADPGQAFNEAVEAAVAERMAQSADA
jgi:hypothetical protein